MLDFPPWKVWGISLLCLIAVALAIPSLLPQSQVNQWASWLPSARINLGLDLAGGSHLLLEADTCLRLAAPRVATENTHGSGCTLASAIAAGLAKGLSLESAVKDAKAYVSAAIAAADRLGVGSGRGPLHHFHAWW